MLTKACSCCGIEKQMDAFQVRAASKDGRTASCRECLKARDKARYPKERTHRAELHRSYMRTDAGKAAHRRATQRWKVLHPEQRQANVLVSNALRDGRLTRQPCHCCGALEVDGHHPDYSRPLDVIWLCPPHHRQLHEDHEALQETLQQGQPFVA